MGFSAGGRASTRWQLEGMDTEPGVAHDAQLGWPCISFRRTPPFLKSGNGPRMPGESQQLDGVTARRSGSNSDGPAKPAATFTGRLSGRLGAVADRKRY
jgi:hypothetical protein